jgi:hypothetical protein
MRIHYCIADYFLGGQTPLFSAVIFRAIGKHGLLPLINVGPFSFVHLSIRRIEIFSNACKDVSTSLTVRVVREVPTLYYLLLLNWQESTPVNQHKCLDVVQWTAQTNKG